MPLKSVSVALHRNDAEGPAARKGGKKKDQLTSVNAISLYWGFCRVSAPCSLKNTHYVKYTDCISPRKWH